jgi:hypothetical protein
MQSGGKPFNQPSTWFAGRTQWWRDYTDPVWCVFGHYAIPADQPHFFGKAVCVDFGGGYRAKERAATGFNGTFTTRLGAARFPEGIVIFDDGSSQEIHPQPTPLHG